MSKKIMKFLTTNKENEKFVVVKQVSDATMKTKINYQINERYFMKEKEINYYKNKMIDIQIKKNYIGLMLN